MQKASTTNIKAVLQYRRKPDRPVISSKYQLFRREPGRPENSSKQLSVKNNYMEPLPHPEKLRKGPSNHKFQAVESIGMVPIRRSSISWSEAKLFGGQTWFGSLLGSLSTVINITLICSVQFTKYSDYHSHVNNIHIYLFSSDKSPSLKANA